MLCAAKCKEMSAVMRVKRRLITKVPTLISGLDEVLEGGLPRGRTTLASGGPGSGKTVLGLEFLYSGAMAGEAGVFVTFEERAEAVRENALSMGMDVAAMEKAGKVVIVEARLFGEEVIAGDFDIQGLLAIVGGHIKRIKAKRVVMDALDVLLRVFNNPQRERNELYRLHEWLIDRKLTNVLTAKSKREGESELQFEFLDFMADCVLRMDHRVIGQVATRRLRVIKYRGSGFGTNEYPYVIGSHGIILFPLTKAELSHKSLGIKVSTGLTGLDLMLNGGYRRASCVMVTGASGTGKTTLASTMVEAACRRGERVLFLSFEESKEAIVTAMGNSGINLKRAIQAGKLLMQTGLPEAMGSDGHLIRALEAIDAFKPDHVTLDAASACIRMGSEQAAFEYLMRLVSILKERGITCVMTNQLSEIDSREELSGIGFSSVVDAVIQLRYVESDQQISRQVLVVKSRGSAHSSRRTPFTITDRGIKFPDKGVWLKKVNKGSGTKGGGK